MKCLPVEPRPLDHALALARALVDAAADERCALLAASEVRGPAVVLGRSQRAGRVLDLAACAARGTTVLRRESSGAAAYVGPGRSLVFALALPDVASLAHDARPATLLNRNVRGFLQGFARAGALAHYFGRDWISVHHRPAVLLGFDVAPSGAVLIELLAGFDAPVALPSALASSLERTTERYRGREPLALLDASPAVARASDALAFADRVLDGFCTRFDQPREPLAAPRAPPPPATPVSDAHDPLPAELVAGEPVACPIGFCEAAADDRGALWLGGDVLAPRAWLDAAAAAIARGETPVADDSVALEGATVDDLRAAATSARRAARSSG